MSVELGDNIIDSRDVIKEIEALRSNLDGTPFADTSNDSDELRTILDNTPAAWKEHFDADEAEKLINLLDFQEQGEFCSDWRYGAAFILDEYFEEYAQQLADDIGAVKTEGWPTNCIDWEQAANDLKSDYSCIEVDGHTYWVRS